jgi:putative transposase
MFINEEVGIYVGKQIGEQYMPWDESFNPEYSKRALRGAQMIEEGVTPKKLSKDKFEILSQTGDKTYTVSNYAHKWQCTCPDFKYCRVSCKHIHAITLWQKLSVRLQEDNKKKTMVAPLHNEFGCKFCGSLHIIKYGKKKGKQYYMCKSCARKFVFNKGFEGLCYDSRVVAATLDLYFKGVSLRKITDHLHQCHGLDIDHSTVYRWICRYIDVIEAYVATLEPELGDIWHGDEMKIKVKGEWKWLWNTMDEKTRFQLVSMISETRETQEARKTFRKSKDVARKKPKLIVTDGLASYKGAFRSEFYDHHQSVKHVADVALETGMNNVIERMHGSFREREKVMRGIKTMETPIFDGNRIYYNFIRPHQALDGKTPAELAGIGVSGENKWEELLRRSANKRR